MTELSADERELVGGWEESAGRTVADATARRIELLVSSALERVASSADGWDTLFRDPKDGRLWELSYPDSGTHAGGAPRLTALSVEEAAVKYGPAVRG